MNDVDKAYINELKEEIKQLKTSTYCAYCGAKFLLDDSAATKVTEHIYSCPKHPMRDVEIERDKLRAELNKRNGKR